MKTPPTVTEYFAGKATQYDDVDQQVYWKLSDDLLWFLLQERFLPASSSAQFHLVDAGAGTARWSSRILEAYPNSTADLLDLSPDMLSVARQKLDDKGQADRVRILQGDVRQLDGIQDASADLLICFHNVLGFFNDTESALASFYKKLKPGGRVALMFPSFYHALYFSNSVGRVGELQRIVEESHVKYNDLMPALKVFKLPDIFAMLATCGFENGVPFGFPITLYPGMEETMIHGSTESLTNIISDANYRARLMSIEEEMCIEPALAARGNNLLILAEKT